MGATLHDELNSAQEAMLGVYHGKESVASFGDVAAEFAAFRSGCALWRADWLTVLRVSGPDRLRWLNGMVTNNVRDLPVDRGVYSFVLNAQGRILGDMHIYNRGDTFSLVTDVGQRERLLELFDKFIIMDDVQVAPIEQAAAFGLRGPKVHEVLKRTGFELEKAGPLELREARFRGTTVRLIRSEQATGCEVWAGSQEAEDLWKGLNEAGATSVGYGAVELARIAMGIPAYGQDIRERDMPQETGQQRALHFNKGCYVGQEIVERIHSRGNVHRQFSGFTFASAPPAVGSKVLAEDGKEAGEITSAATLPLAEGARHVALGYVRRESALPGNILNCGGQVATLVTLPIEKL